MISSRRLLAAFGCLALAVASQAQYLRVATWNVSDFTGSDRLTDIRSVLFNVGPFGSMDPDILIAQELQSPGAAAAFLGSLNTAEPNTWAVTYGSLTGTSSTSDTAVFYKSAKVSLAASPFRVAAAGGTSGQPRDTWRFDFHITGNAHSDEVLSIYDVHMKAGSTSTDVDRRNIESQHIRTDSNALASNYLFILAGDMNMQASTQSAYQTLVTAGTNSRGEFYDPIKSPGTWDSNPSFRYIHTQDPAGNGGMDSRYDQLLLSSNLIDRTGTDYVGDPNVTFSTTTWNDPNHSYRCWGNDGTSYKANLTVANNQEVGPTIAQAIINAASPPGIAPGGHCPVFLDLHFDTAIQVSGHVDLQSYTASPGGTPVTVTFRPAGSSTVVDTKTATLDASGNFALTTTAPPGDYDITVKASHWLAQKLAETSLTLGGTSGLNWSLFNGDVNGDNAITLGDFTAAKAAFGSVAGDPSWNPAADLNGDGAVTLSDIAILRANFGRQGD